MRCALWRIESLLAQMHPLEDRRKPYLNQFVTPLLTAMGEGSHGSTLSVNPAHPALIRVENKFRRIV